MKKVFCLRNILFLLVYFSILFFLRAYITKEPRHLIQAFLLLAGIVATLIFKYNGLYFSTVIYSAVVIHLSNFNLYPTLLFLTIATMYNRRFLTPAALIYHASTITLFALDPHALNINVIIFYSASVLIYFVIYFYPKITEKALKLTADEIELLEEWSEKELLKACSCFSKNVKTEKLKRARERNNLKSNEELKALYLINKRENKITKL